MADARQTLPPALLSRLTTQPLALHRPALDALMAGVPLAMEQRDQAKSRTYIVTDGVAVIPVSGIMLKRGTGDELWDDLFGIAAVENLAATFRMAMADPAVRAVLLQIDSPGGEVFGIFDLADAVYAARGTKPIVAVADELACSAAYLLASAADRIVVPRMGVVGSVGVIAVRLDATAYDAQAGLRYSVITAGARKADGNPHVPTSDAELERMREDVAVIGELFVDAVARNRGRDAAAVAGLEADTFRGDEAVAAGLADQVGTFDDALRDLAGRQPQGRRKETGMQQQNGQGAPAAAGGDNVVSLDEARRMRDEGTAAGVNAERARVAAITELCMLAGMPDRAAQFVTSGATEAEARSALAASRAGSAAAHDVRGVHHAQGAQAPKGNPGLVAECRRIAGVKE